jgi:hypothetical protein
MANGLGLILKGETSEVASIWTEVLIKLPYNIHRIWKQEQSSVLDRKSGLTLEDERED